MRLMQTVSLEACSGYTNNYLPVTQQQPLTALHSADVILEGVVVQQCPPPH